MELLQSIHHWFTAGACLLAAAAALFCGGAWFYTSPSWRTLFSTLGRQFRALSPAGKLLAIVFLATFIVKGGTKTNNVPPPSPPAGGMVFDGGFQMESGMESEDGGLAAPRLTTNQYRAGFALVRVATNVATWFAAPSNAVLHAPWTRYGVAEDTFWLPATNWGFILGTNAVDGLHVSSSGTLSFGRPKGSPRARGLPDGSELDFLAPLQTHIGIAPPVGRFWHAPTLSNSLLLTWQDVFANRDTNYPVSFQSELFANGDFTFRYDFSSLQPPASSLPTTNFVVGAQHNAGGETYASGDANAVADGLELRWRAFGLLDPGIADHDGDGLSTYDEVMIHGTSPRRTDTDGDGLSDFAEIYVHGTDPLNPDTNGDGIPDGMSSAEWHSNPLLSPGADKRLVSLYCDLDMPPGASAVLRFGDLPIILGTTNTWDLYLPAGTEYTVELVPLGGPIVDLSLCSQPGLVIDDPLGILSSAATIPDRQDHFPLGVMSSSGSGDGTTPSTGGSFTIYCVSLGIYPTHHVLHGEELMQIHAVLLPPSASLFQDSISWHVEYVAPHGAAYFNPIYGGGTTLYWPDDGFSTELAVRARFTDSQMGQIDAACTLWRCRKWEPLHWENCTTNFSPRLCEEATFKVYAGCDHMSGYEGQWLEMEAGRETVDGWQHVAWIDMDADSPGLQKRARIDDDWRGATARWDGTAAASVPAATNPDTFELGPRPFQRLLPAIEAGMPLPPPFYDVIARVRAQNSDAGTVVAQTEHRFFVPQVVKIEWDDVAANFLAQPQDFRHGSFSTNLYSGCGLSESYSALSGLHEMVQAKFPFGVNIRVVDKQTSTRPPYKIVNLVRGADPEKDPTGLTRDFSFHNLNSEGTSFVYLLAISNAFYKAQAIAHVEETSTNVEWRNVRLPLYPADMLATICGSATHEIGHMLGLVDPNYLGGASHLHNVFSAPQFIMNLGTKTPMEVRIERTLPRDWYYINLEYLKFILPTE